MPGPAMRLSRVVRETQREVTCPSCGEPYLARQTRTVHPCARCRADQAIEARETHHLRQMQAVAPRVSADECVALLNAHPTLVLLKGKLSLKLYVGEDKHCYEGDDVLSLLGEARRDGRL